MATDTPGSAARTRPDVRQSAAARDIDWTAVEASPEFRELVARRRRFVFVATAVFLTGFLAYLILMTYGRGVMATQVFGVITLGWIGGVIGIVMAWVITYVYLRASNKVFTPLEERAARKAEEIGESNAGAAPAVEERRFAR